jgi:hypothetical protein
MKSRELTIDYARFIAITLVVVGHLIQYNIDDYDKNYIYKVIYSFYIKIFIYIYKIVLALLGILIVIRILNILNKIITKNLSYYILLVGQRYTLEIYLTYTFFLVLFNNFILNAVTVFIFIILLVYIFENKLQNLKKIIFGKN